MFTLFHPFPYMLEKRQNRRVNAHVTDDEYIRPCCNASHFSFLFSHFYSISPRNAAIAAAVPCAAVAKTAGKPPVSRRAFHWRVAGNMLFPPLSRRFPPT
jgi:hypothetical protein